MSIKELHPTDESRSYLHRVQNHAFPEEASPLVDAYAATVGDRDPFLWKWAHHLFPKFTLSCVPRDTAARLRTDKLVGLMFVSVLDDVAEMHADRATFEEAAKIPFEHTPVDPDRDGVDREVISFAGELWSRFSPALDDAPRSAEFRELVRFDLKQVHNAIDYSCVVNQDIEFVSESELRSYDVHNMMLYVFADLDIVHSPDFDRSELSTLRQVIERTQRMVRIGNWITTWERELHESDFTSGIVVYALENGIVSSEDLRALRTDGDAVEPVAETIRDHDVEEIFLHQWERELDAARAFEGALDTVDVSAYLDGIESVMDYHLASRGLK